MVRFIPMFILMGSFAIVGLYWALLARHFMKWTTRYNAKMCRQANDHVNKSVMVLDGNNETAMFAWAVRGIGLGVLFITLYAIANLVSLS
jgi:hypothetical protein